MRPPRRHRAPRTACAVILGAFDSHSRYLYVCVCVHPTPAPRPPPHASPPSFRMRTGVHAAMDAPGAPWPARSASGHVPTAFASIKTSSSSSPRLPPPWRAACGRGDVSPHTHHHGRHDPDRTPSPPPTRRKTDRILVSSGPSRARRGTRNIPASGTPVPLPPYPTLPLLPGARAQP
ncbi:hypothetical protein BD413DRAFT_502247 [Trametes elegans]|nr:hypothetical protein BD413DRAFT_502247 [Trametes elegans]